MKLYTLPRLSWFHLDGRHLQLVTVDGKYAYARDEVGNRIVLRADTEVDS